MRKFSRFNYKVLFYKYDTKIFWEIVMVGGAVTKYINTVLENGTFTFFVNKYVLTSVIISSY